MAPDPSTSPTSPTAPVSPGPARQPAQRRRPAPTSALSPAPGPLMPGPADEHPGGESGRAGRRQHHRAPGRPAAEDLVYLSGRIPRHLRDELHVRAIGEGRPVVDLMRDALRGYLDQHGGPSRS